MICEKTEKTQQQLPLAVSAEQPPPKNNAPPPEKTASLVADQRSKSPPKKYGQLLPLLPIPSTRGKESHWLCKCDCGDFAIVTLAELKTGAASGGGGDKVSVLR